MAGTTVAWKGLASGVLSRGGEGREHYLQERTKQRAIKKQHEGSHEGGELYFGCNTLYLYNDYR